MTKVLTGLFGVSVPGMVRYVQDHAARSQCHTPLPVVIATEIKIV